jgi:toluene monooxygenase system protein A
VPCKWIFEQAPHRFKGHTSLVDRFLLGQIQPPNLEGALTYMGLSPEECGQDATNYDWAAVPYAPGAKLVGAAL